MFNLKFRNLLPQAVDDELVQLVAQIRGYVRQQHDEEGGHTAVTADTVEADAVTVVEQENDGNASTGRVVWRALGGANGITETILRHFTDIMGIVAGKVFRITSGAREVHLELNGVRHVALGVLLSSDRLPEQRFHGALTALNTLCLRGQSTYVPAPNDTAAFSDFSDGPRYAVYLMQPTAAVTIDGIYTDLFSDGGGQTLIAVNDSDYAVTFQSGVVSNGRKIIGDPVTIGKDGAVVFVYDIAKVGWRIIAVHPGDAIAYTPVWTAASVNPTIGDGAITGQWQQVGRMVHVTILIQMGSTTTFGTGVYDFSLPVAAPPVTFGSTDKLIGPGLASDDSVPAFNVGAARLATTTTVRYHGHGTAGAASPTVPFTWAVNDVLRIQGSYLRA